MVDTPLTITPPTTPIVLTDLPHPSDINLSHLNPSSPVVLTPAAQALIVNLSAGSQTAPASLSVIDCGGELYTTPYWEVEGGNFYYYSWQHVDGQQWKAQRISKEVFEIETVTGLNPQPENLADFETLEFV